MKRLDIDSESFGNADILIESDDGDYVEWKYVQELIAEVARLRKLLWDFPPSCIEESPNKIMSADELPDEGYYLWREEPTDKWEPVQVQIDVDGVLMKTIWEIHYVHAYGQFYGPLVGPD